MKWFRLFDLSAQSLGFVPDAHKTPRPIQSHDPLHMSAVVISLRSGIAQKVNGPFQGQIKRLCRGNGIHVERLHAGKEKMSAGHLALVVEDRSFSPPHRDGGIDERLVCG